MRGTYAIALATVCVGLPFQASGFAPAPLGHTKSVVNRLAAPGSKNVISRPQACKQLCQRVLKATNGEGDEQISDASGFFSDLTINAPYALAYILFVGFVIVRQAAEPEGASNALIQQYFADPLNPGFNELFITVFNLLGLYAIPLACLLMPGAKGQKLPATPFVAGSLLAGYGALGLYTSTRKPNPSPITKADLGWFTANVLENKAFNWFIILVFSSAYVTSGALGALITDPGELIKGYADLFQEKAIVSGSSLDFLILTISAASFIPEDLERRGYRGDLAPSVIAALSCLLPGAGAALYCALRPSLEDE